MTDHTAESVPSTPADHPERTCARCGGPNITWCAPSPLWNAVMRGGSIDGVDEFHGIVCPVCFAQLAEERGIAKLWRLSAQSVLVELETVTPSGRVWDDEAWLWREPAEPLAQGGIDDPEELFVPDVGHVSRADIEMIAAATGGDIRSRDLPVECADEDEEPYDPGDLPRMAPRRDPALLRHPAFTRAEVDERERAAYERGKAETLAQLEAALAEVERLRGRIHEVAADAQRRYGKTESELAKVRHWMHDALRRHNEEMATLGRQPGTWISGYGQAAAAAIIQERDEAFERGKAEGRREMLAEEAATADSCASLLDTLPGQDREAACYRLQAEHLRNKLAVERAGGGQDGQ